jgi:hypothetical protein
MWTCNICFKTFNCSTSYFNHRKSHRSNCEISSSDDEMSSSELKSSNNEFCPYIKLTNLYNLIPIESINETVHIVPQFEKANSYYVNTFITL